MYWVGSLELVILNVKVTVMLWNWRDDLPFCFRMFQLWIAEAFEYKQIIYSIESVIFTVSTGSVNSQLGKKKPNLQ